MEHSAIIILKKLSSKYINEAYKHKNDFYSKIILRAVNIPSLLLPMDART